MEEKGFAKLLEQLVPGDQHAAMRRLSAALADYFASGTAARGLWNYGRPSLDPTPLRFGDDFHDRWHKAIMETYDKLREEEKADEAAARSQPSYRWGIPTGSTTT